MTEIKVYFETEGGKEAFVEGELAISQLPPYHSFVTVRVGPNQYVAIPANKVNRVQGDLEILVTGGKELEYHLTLAKRMAQQRPGPGPMSME